MTPPELTPPAVPGVTTHDGAHLPLASRSRRWRVVDRLAIVAFALALVLPSAAMLAGARPQAIENRPLLTAPPFTPGSIWDPAWSAAVDRAIADNLVLRPRAIRLRAAIDLALSGSPSPDVIRGVDDWLFYRDDLVALCPVGAAELVTRLDAAAAAFAAAGQEFRFIIAPDKHVYYGDRRRPDDGIPAPCTDAARPSVRAALATRGAFAVDGWSAVDSARAALPGTELYFRQDSHWVPVAALMAIRDLMLSLDPALWSEADVVAGEPRAFQMDLAQILGVPRTEAALDPLVRPGVQLRTTAVEPPAGLHLPYPIQQISAQGDRRLLGGRTVVVYDSYFGRATNKLAAFFADSTWIHIDDLKQSPDLVRQLGPFDRVIYEEVERYVYRAQLDTLVAPLVRIPR